MINRRQRTVECITTRNSLETRRTRQPKRFDAERLVGINLQRRQKRTSVGQEDPLLKIIRFKPQAISWGVDIATPVPHKLIGLQGWTLDR